MRAFVFAWSTVAAFLLAILAYFAAHWWLFGRTHEFGPNDPRHWFLARGTLADELGPIGSLPGSVRYRAEPRDGNAPPRLMIVFRTSLDPTDTIERYAVRCADAGADARRTGETALLCVRGGAEVGVTAREDGSSHEVAIGGWITAP